MIGGTVPPPSLLHVRRETWSPSSCVRDLVTFLPVHVCLLLLLLGTAAAAADADGLRRLGAKRASGPQQ